MSALSGIAEYANTGSHAAGFTEQPTQIVTKVSSHAVLLFEGVFGHQAGIRTRRSDGRFESHDLSEFSRSRARDGVQLAL